MKTPIEEYTDPQALYRIMENAKRLGDEDLQRRVFRRLCTLEGIDQDGPLEREFHETLRAYELLLTEKNGRTTKASRTRQKLKNKGIIQCLEDWAVSTMPTEGFELLISRGFVELTGEYLVLKYQNLFSPSAVRAARERLQRLGVDVPPVPASPAS